MVSNLNLDPQQRAKAEECLQNKQNMLSTINFIKGKTSGFYDPGEQGHNSNNDSNGLNQQQKYEVTQIGNNDQLLKKRGEEIQEVYKTSQKIVETTNAMAQKINDQGAILDDIEGHVMETVDNINKGNKEIVEANEIATGNSKRMYCLMCIIFLLLLGIGGIVCAVIFGGKD